MNINDVNLKKIFNSAIKNHKENNFSVAEKLYQQILEIAPSHFDSIFHLATLFALKKNFDKAKKLLEKAIQIRPNHVSAYNNLGGILLEQGNYYEALASYQKATLIDPNHTNARNNLAVLLRSEKIRKINKKESTNLKALFLFLFRRNDIQHATIFRNAKSILFSEKKYAELLKTINLNSSLLKKSTIQALLKEELFLLMLQKSVTEDFFLEKILTKLRCEILFHLIDSKKNILDNNLKFIISLSEQCFFNEYVFFQTKKEISYINKLIKKIEINKKINEIEVAILGCYIPLCSFENIVKKLSNYKSNNILFNDLIAMQIKEPMREKALKNSIKSLSKIFDEVSTQVRDQYEENPYPRWRYTYDQLPSPFLTRLWRQIRPNKIKIQNKFNNPNVLVAGCGTGHHACIAKDYLNSNVLGIDLSLPSLAYAKRKTDELNFNNIEYLNADILELHKLKKKFDVIECVGVLHHMKEPLKGLKILLDLLEPHGVVKLGLYSEKARQHIIRVREFIKKNKFKNTIADIRACREAIFNKKEDEMFKKILHSSDFYATSSARDLMFHVQEHRFTLPQISKMISDFDLEFLGFSNEKIKNKYSKLFPDDKEKILLENWDKFETSDPDTFVGMYNFWLRRKIH